MTPIRLGIVDANSMGYAHHNGTTLSLPNGFQTQAIFGFVRMLRNFRNDYPEAKFLIIWDGKAKKRYDVLPTYKGDREAARAADPEKVAAHSAYKAQLPVIAVATELMGFDQIMHPLLEADDIAGILCRDKPTVPKKLFTGDEDYLQLVDEFTQWFDPRRDGRLVTHDKFHQSTGFFTPYEFLQGKALQGDTSDSIPGIHGIADKTAAAFLAEHRSVPEFFAKVDAGTYTPKVRKSKTAATPHPEQVLASPEGRAMYYRNMELMDLRDPQKPEGNYVITPGRFNPLALCTLFSRLGFMSITKNFDTWVERLAPQTTTA